MSYRVSAPDEYLAITGMSVRSVKITKAAWVWPFQRCTRFSVQPHDYALDLQAMTKEKGRLFALFTASNANRIIAAIPLTRCLHSWSGCQPARRQQPPG